MWCRRAQRDLTAVVDGELTPWRTRLVRGHLDGCPACREELAAVERTVHQQRELLPRLDDAAPLAVDDMLRRVRAGLREHSEPEQPRFWLTPPLIAAVAAGAIVVFGLLRMSEPILVAVGLEEPPEVVVEKADLFRDYTLFENFDTIEHLEPGSKRRAESRS